MRFSIITVTYNAEKYLEETLRSVAEQQFQDYEHILWDGGSSDRTLEIARKFPGLKIVEGKDEGLSDAMNQGASCAQGEFLLHLHADDILANPKALLVVDTCLRQHPQVKWLYGQTLTMDCEGKIIAKPPFVPFCRKKLSKYNILSHPSTFISRALFEKVGGFSCELSLCMDYDLWLRLSKLESAFALPYFISAFRQHDGSLSTKRPLEVALEAHQLRKKHTKNPYLKWRSYRTWKKRMELILHAHSS